MSEIYKSVFNFRFALPGSALQSVTSYLWQEPRAVMPPARICAGGEPQGSSLPRPVSVVWLRYVVFEGHDPWQQFFDLVDRMVGDSGSLGMVHKISNVIS